MHRDDELISFGRAKLRRALILVAPKHFQGSTESRPTLKFMESFNLQDWTRIGTMDPFLQPKPKRQRTGAVQDLAEARKHMALACVLEMT